MKTPLQLAAIAAILAVSGCIKDPHPPIPEPPKNPGWLIVSRTIIDAYEQFFPDPDGPQDSYTKRLTTFQYNKYYKPAVRVDYTSPRNDTMNLSRTLVDSFFYDGSHRVKEIRTYRGAVLALGNVKSFTYNGMDTLPASVTFYSVSAGLPGESFTTSFVYESEDVLAITEDGKTGSKDTTRYVYQNGNFTKFIAYYGEMEVYADYLSAPNPERYYNIPHGLAIHAPLEYTSMVKLSRNQWGTAIQQSIYAGAIPDGRGLVTQVRITDPYSIGNKYYNVRYEYSDDVLK